MNVPASAKYEIIREMTRRDNNLLNIKWLCAAAGVSRSGYYHYLETEELRQRREGQDRKDFLIVLLAYQFRGYNKGARGIYMRLLHMKSPAHVNIKKIRRLMKQYRLLRLCSPKHNRNYALSLSMRSKCPVLKKNQNDCSLVAS